MLGLRAASLRGFEFRARGLWGRSAFQGSLGGLGFRV